MAALELCKHHPEEEFRITINFISIILDVPPQIFFYSE